MTDAPQGYEHLYQQTAAPRQPPPQPRPAQAPVSPAPAATTPPADTTRVDQPKQPARYAPVETQLTDPQKETNTILVLASLGALLGIFCCGPIGWALMGWSMWRLLPLLRHFSGSDAKVPAKLVVALFLNIAGISLSIISTIMLAAYTFG